MSGPSSILVVRWGRLGDLLLAAGATREIRRAWPGATIDLAVKAEYAEAAALLPGVDRIVPFGPGGMGSLVRDRRRLQSSYDLAVDLHGNTRARLLLLIVRPRRTVRYRRLAIRRRWLVKTKRGRGGGFPPVWRRYIEAVARAGAHVRYDVPRLTGTERAGPEGSIALAPGAGRPTKMWPAERFAETARILAASEERPIVLIGAASEKTLLEEVKRAAGVPASIVAGASIPETAAVLRNAAVVVTNDSGVLHLATGVGAPVVALFGPTTPELGFPPASENHVLLSRDLSCRPCSLHGGEVCPLADHSHACLTGIGAAEAAEAAQRILRDSAPAVG